MRTTVTLEPDVEALLRRSMRDHGLSFKEALNKALRSGLTETRAGEPFRVETFEMGEPLIPLVKALQLAGELEDEAILEKMQQRR